MSTKDRIRGTVPVSKIFGNDIQIPFNQRPYEWSNDLIEGFLDSLAEYTTDCFNEEETPYFFIGTIITYESDDANHIEIVDGQQRILTLYMISLMFEAMMDPSHLNHNLRLLEPDNLSTWTGILTEFKPDKIKFANNRVDEDMQDLFKQLEMGSKISAFKAKDEDPDNNIFLVKYRNNAGLTESKRVYKLYAELTKTDGVVSSFFKALDDKEEEWKAESENEQDFKRIRRKKLREYKETFVGNIRISQLSASHRETAWELFENFNAKRQPLSSDSLIKSLVLFKSINDPDCLKMLAEQWEDVVKKLSTDNYVISMKDYIRFYWNSFQPHSTEKKIYRAFSNYIEQDADNANQFVDDLDKNVEDYLWITSQKEMRRRVNTQIEKNISLILFRLRLSNAKVFAPGALAVMTNQFLKENEPLRYQILLEFLELAEKTFFNVSILESSPSTIEKLFAKFAYTLNGGPATRTQALNNIDKIKNEITNLEKDIKKYLKISNRSLEDFKKGFIGGFSVNASKAALHYLNTQTMQSTTYNPPLESKEIHLEHILPQTITKGGTVIEDWNYYTDVLHEDYSNRIGNMILMKDKHNQGLGNKSFKEKLDRYNSILSSGGQELKPLIEFCLANNITDKWTDENIDKRSEQLFDRIYEYYKFA